MQMRMETPRFNRLLGWIFPKDAIHKYRPMIDGVAQVKCVRMVEDSSFQKHICDMLLKYNSSGFIFSNAKIPQRLGFFGQAKASDASTESNQDTIKVAMFQNLTTHPFNSISGHQWTPDGFSVREKPMTNLISSKAAQDL